MEMAIKLLKRFENDLGIGWDYAINMLSSGLPYYSNSKYHFLISYIIVIYYEAYNLYGADTTDYDDGLVYEIRSNQIYLLLRILKDLENKKGERE